VSLEARLTLQAERAEELASRVRSFLGPLRGDERALDVGCGTGALAFALAPLVGEVVALDSNPEFVAAARELAPPNVAVLEGDATALPFEAFSFDLAGCMRVLHHAHRPELVVAELARVVRPGGRVLVVDQLGAVDPLVSLELDRFERARDPSHRRLLPDADVRAYLDANDLVVERNEIVVETRDLERYLALADADPALARAAPAGVRQVEIGWYLARRRF
jgi:ubiquinone/menaquinone biosynthesis C-methylase UbiE